MAYLAGYTTRRKLTIDNTKIDAALSNFPIAIKLTSANFDFAKANADGFDIRFTSSDGETLLKYERERHDNGNSLAEYWVKVPTVASGADTDIYMYYRTTDTADGADATNVWDANYKAVYHLKEDDTGTTIADSTGNNTAAKKANAEPTQVNGKIGKGQSFDGSDDYITIPYSATTDIGTEDMTAEFWMKASSLASWAHLLGYRHDSGSLVRWCFEVDANDYIVFTIVDTDISVGQNQGTSDTADNSWHYIAGTLDRDSATGMKLYVDETCEDTDNPTAAEKDINPANRDGLIGKSHDANQEASAIIDEVRISKGIARSAAWIKASYNSGNNSLLTYGSEESSATTISVSDQLNLTEDTTVQIPVGDITISVSDQLNITEDITSANTQLGGVSVFSSLTITEQVVSENSQLGGIDVFDGISITEDVGIVSTLTLSVSDNITLTELTSLENTQLGNISVLDNVSLTENLTKITTFYVSVNDGITTTENVAMTNTQLGGINVNDSLTITESVVMANVQLGGVSISDQLNLTEATTFEINSFISVLDATSLTEAITIENTLSGISVSDQMTITESAVVDISVIVLAISISDDIILTEDVSSANTQLGSVSVFDQLNLTEDTTLANTQLGSINVSDQLNLTESAVVQYSVTSIDVSVNDALTISENVVLTNTQLGEISLSDQLNLTENVVAETSSSSINVSDTLTISENIGKIATIKISILDEITIAELISSSVILPTPFKPTLRIETMKPIIEIKSTGSILTIKTIKPIMKII